MYTACPKQLVCLIALQDIVARTRIRRVRVRVSDTRVPVSAKCQTRVSKDLELQILGFAACEVGFQVFTLPFRGQLYVRIDGLHYGRHTASVPGSELAQSRLSV